MIISPKPWDGSNNFGHNTGKPGWCTKLKVNISRKCKVTVKIDLTHSELFDEKKKKSQERWPGDGSTNYWTVFWISV